MNGWFYFIKFAMEKCISIMKKYLTIVVDVLVAPFVEYFWLFVVFFLQGVIIEAVSSYHELGFSELGVKTVVDNSVQELLYSYLLALICCVCVRIYHILGKIIIGVLLLVGTVMSVIDTVCYALVLTPLRRNVIIILRTTNPTETMEFFLSCTSWYVISKILTIIIVLIAVGCCFAKYRLQLGKRLSLFFICTIFLIAVWLNVKGSCSIFSNTPITKLIHLFDDTSTMVDLSKNRIIPVVEVNSPTNGEDIVVIIGESLCRDKMSIYGYQRPTTPHLAKDLKTGALIKFELPSMNSVSTIESFQKFMTTYPGVGKTTKEWFEYPNLIEIMKAAGYKNIWISNQREYGGPDNGVSSFAHICNNRYFVGDKYVGIMQRSYDEAVIPTLRNEIINQSKDTDNRIVYIHLSGQHEYFYFRYPKSFDYFKEDEYTEYLKNQRQTLAQYDNSVRYNDFVVDRIMHCFDNRTSIIIYFSDHALDLYESNQSIAGHGTHSNKISEFAASKIPFLVYVTPKYKQAHQDLVNRLSEVSGNPVVVDDILYTIMDIAGIEFVGSEDVRKYSILR